MRFIASHATVVLSYGVAVVVELVLVGAVLVVTEVVSASAAVVVVVLPGLTAVTTHGWVIV
jgi:hypothetical protein